MTDVKKIILGSIACSLLLLCIIFSRNLEKHSDKPIASKHQDEQISAIHPNKSWTPPKADHKPHGEDVPDKFPDKSKSRFWSVSVSNRNQTKITTRSVEQKLMQLSRTSKPNDPPYIGDAYMTEEFQPQTNCSDGIRGQITDSDIGPLFLKNIPVLLMAKHITLEHYQRLSLYTGVHGWQNINYGTLLEAKVVFSSPATWHMFDDWKDRKKQSECITCAVVGNGGILKNSRKGKEIDSHHYVFRTNGAITKGFEQDVGSRTTHYTFTTNTLMNSLKDYKTLGFTGPPQSKETRYLFLPSDKRDFWLVTAAVTHTQVDRGQDRGQDPSKYFGKNVTAEKFKMLHPDFMRYIRNRFVRSEYLKGANVHHFRPTTGAAMLLAALHTCDKVSAYGFMTTDYRRYSLYYYDRRYRQVAFGNNHDRKMEVNLWQQLHRAGLIKLFTAK